VTTLTQQISRAATTKSRPSALAAKPVERSDMLSSILETLEDAKAEQTIVIDLAGKTTLADAMVITTGRVNRHVSAIADQVIEMLKQHGHTGMRVEGQPHCDWVLIDAGDVILHVFRPEVRSFYNLEKMWGSDRPAERGVS
jgi:ribosome-associated protein